MNIPALPGNGRKGSGGLDSMCILHFATGVGVVVVVLVFSFCTGVRFARDVLCVCCVFGVCLVARRFDCEFVFCR